MKKRFWELLSELEAANKLPDNHAIRRITSELEEMIPTLYMTPDEWTAAVLVLQKMNGEVYAQ